MHRTCAIVLLLVGAGVARASPDTAVTASGTSAREGATDLGLPFLWLPIESRTRFEDYAGFWVPGAGRSASGGLILGGGRPQDSATFVDGFWMRRLKLPLGLFGRADVITAGYGSAWSDVAGGVLDLETGPAGDRLGVNAELFYQKGPDLRSRVGTFAVSGPLLPGRLFLAVAGRLEGASGDAVDDPEGIVPGLPAYSGGSLDGAVKVTWLPVPHQRLELLAALGGAWSDNGGNKLGVSPEAQPATDDRRSFAGLTWRGALSDVLSARAQASFQRGSNALLSQLCRKSPDDCDVVPAARNIYPRDVTLDNSTSHTRDADQDEEVWGAVEGRFGEDRLIAQRLTITSRLRASQFEDRQVIPGNAYTTFFGVEPQDLTEGFSNDPRYGAPVPGAFRSAWSTFRTITSAEDQLRIRRMVWVTAGLAVVTAGVHGGHLDVDRLAVAPRIGLAVDLTGDGKTWLRTSSGLRVVADVESLGRFAQGSQVQRNCQWNSDLQSFTKRCVLSGAVAQLTMGLPCGSDGLGSANAEPCRGSLALPTSSETTAGVERDLGWGAVAGVDLVYRTTSGLPLPVETNYIWNASESDVVGYRNGRATRIVDWSSRPDERRRYLGVTASLEKRTGALSALVAYTWSHLRSTSALRLPDVYYPSPRPLNLPTRALQDDPDDRSHSFRLLVRYDVLGFASLALAYRYQSPSPGERLDEALYFSTPQSHRLNLEARVRLKRLVGADVDVFGDAVDVVATRVVATDPLSFTAAPPSSLVLRLGVQYRR